jgi:CSLREA domain-containing protein
VLALAAVVCLVGAAQAQTAHLSGWIGYPGSGLSMGFPDGVAVDSAGNLYLADYDNKRVLKLTGIVTCAGTLPQPGCTVVADFSSNPNGYYYPYHIAVDTSGDLYVSLNNSAPSDTGSVVQVPWISATNSYGSPTTVFTAVSSQPGHPNCLANAVPKGVALDGKGNLYVSEQVGNSNGDIYVMPASGSNLNCTSSGVQQLASGAPISDVAVDSTYIYWAVYNTGIVWRTPLADCGTSGCNSTYSVNAASGFSWEQGLKLDASGNLYVADSNNGRIVEVPSNGSGGYGTAVNIFTGFNWPNDVAVDAKGNIFGANSLGNEVLKTSLKGTPDFGSVPIGTTGNMTLTFTFDTGGSLAPITPPYKVAGDFVDAGGGTCATNPTSHSYNVGDTCTVNVTFQPKTAGPRFGGVTLMTSASSCSGAFCYPRAAYALLRGVGVGPVVTFPSNTTVNTPGGGVTGTSGVAVDSGGNVYVGYLGTVEMVPPGCASAACVSTLGGGFSIPPHGVAVDGAGNVYVADTNHSKVKMVPPGCATSACVSTLGGGFSHPMGIALDSAGNVYVADSTPAVKLFPPGCASSACVSTLGGGFTDPWGVAVDGAGNIYVADAGDSTNNLAGAAVKQIPPGCASSACVSTLGGSFTSPQGIALDSAGNIYVADDGDPNNSHAGAAVKQMPSGCASSACVTTLGGSFTSPQGIALDGAGNIYVNDSGVLEQVDRSDPPALTFTAVGVGATSTDSPRPVVLANIGNAALSFPVPASGSNPSISSAYNLYSTGTTCPQVGSGSSSAGTLAAGASCTLAVNFAPIVLGSNPGALVLTDNHLNAAAPNYATQAVALAGSGKAQLAFYVIPTSIPAGGSAGWVTVQEVDGKGKLYANGSDSITLTVTAPDGSTFYSASTTASSGSASFDLTAAMTLAGGYSFQAGGSNVVSTSQTVTVTPGSAQHVAAAGGTPQYALIGTAFDRPLQAKVSDAYGNGVVAGVTVGFVVNGSAAGAGAILSSGTALTNSAGVASVTATANATAGAYTATASVTGVTGSAGFSLTNVTTANLVVTTAADATAGVASNCSPQSSTSSGTDAACSLRDAIAYANSMNAATNIYFDAGQFPATGSTTITLAGGQLEIAAGTTSHLVTINGPGASALAIVWPQSAVLNQNYSRVLQVDSGANVIAGGLTISGGYLVDANGGGINNAGALALSNCAVSGNTSTVGTASLTNVGLGGGIYNSGTLTVSNCTISGNNGEGNWVPFPGSGSNWVMGAGIHNAGTLALTGSTVSGNGLGNITSVGGTLTLTNSTVSGSGGTGASVYAGTVTLNGSTVSGNQGAEAGGIFVYNGAVTLIGSTVSGNTGIGYGPHCLGNQPCGGGINAWAGTLTLINSTVSGNAAASTAAGMGGGMGGGIYVSNAAVTLTNSTVSGNTATSDGGGIYVATCPNSPLTLNNSTVSGNTATSDGGGIYVASYYSNSPCNSLTLNNSTISGNTATSDGGGIYQLSGSVAYLSNTIVAGNTYGSGRDAELVSYQDNGGSWLSNTIEQAPVLAPLGNYGGPTQTMPPLPGSPVICYGVANLVPSGVTTDQRGQPRATTNGGTSCVDAGAVQTHYAITFIQQPTDVAVNIAMSPPPAVQLSESGSPFTGASVAIPLALSGPGTLSNGSASTSTSNGIATYTGLSIDTVATGNTLTGWYGLQSYPFAVHNPTATAVTASVTAANKVYDGTTAATITGCSLTGVLKADVGNVSCLVSAANFADANVGNGKTVTANGITLTGSAAVNYKLASTSATTTANITQAALTVTANSAAMPLGGPVPALTYTITGFANGDTSAVASGTATLATTATASSPVGPYPITFVTKSLAAANYGFTYVSGVLHVYSITLESGLAPVSATTGGTGFTLTLNGANFAANSVVLWNGAVRTTTYVNSNQLTATILSQDLVQEGTVLVTVANPAPNARTLPGQPFAVISGTPVATIRGAALASATDGSGNYVLALRGTDFISGSVVLWGGATLTTNYVSPWQLWATMTPAQYASQPATVTVANPAGMSTGFELQ